MSKSWEQIAFAITLAAFGWLLYKHNTATSQQSGIASVGANAGLSIAPFYTINNIDLPFGTPPNASATVPLNADSVGQQNANGYQGYNTCTTCNEPYTD